MTERDEYEKLIELLNGRLVRLRKKNADFQDVPASLAQEIEELEREVARLETEKGDKYPQQNESVQVGGNVVGEFAGRDLNIHVSDLFVMGDKIGGDKISVGDVLTSVGIAIGKGATAVVYTGDQAASPVDRGELKKLFIPLLDEANKADPEIRPRLLDLTNDLVIEVMSGTSLEEDQSVASLIDMLVSTQPSSKDLVIKTFAPP